MDDDLLIYQLNAQSADKLDERRDIATRSHGGICVVVATAATATFQPLPLVSVILWFFLIMSALSWLAVLESLTAKLAAKNALLIKMEADGKVQGTFLTRERKHWEQIEKRPLQVAVRKAPKAFVGLGTVGLLVTIGFLIYSFVC